MTNSRLHMTGATSLDMSMEYPLKALMEKPRGLWYSFGHEWRDYCRAEEPDRERPNCFQIDLDESKILSIRSPSDAGPLKRVFSKWETRFDFYKLRYEFSGIEIIDPNSLSDSCWCTRGQDHHWPAGSKYSELSRFYRSLDVSSGVIWDLSAIKSSTLLKNGEKLKAAN